MIAGTVMMTAIKAADNTSFISILPIFVNVVLFGFTVFSGLRCLNVIRFVVNWFVVLFVHGASLFMPLFQ